MQIFMNKQSKKEIEETIKRDILKNMSKSFNVIYKIKKYSGNFFLFSFGMFILSFFFLDKAYQAFPLLFSVLCLFIHLYVSLIYKDLFISFFNNIKNSTEVFIKQYLKNNKYSESISHLFTSYIVSVTKKGKISISLKHSIGKRNLILTFYPVLEKEKNINYQDLFGNTILHYILEIQELHRFIGMALLSGADPNIKNNEGISTRKTIEQLYPEYTSFLKNSDLPYDLQQNKIQNKTSKKRL